MIEDRWLSTPEGTCLEQSTTKYTTHTACKLTTLSKVQKEV